VLDSNWRWTHIVGGYQNCYTGNQWDQSLCPDPVTCARNCAIDGADYPGTYGISTSGTQLNLQFVTHGQYGNNVGSRTYLMQDDSHYNVFSLLNKEFTFDVDVSNLPCGLNGALYFVEMPGDGGMNWPGNKAGAKYGTGYCDAQCPHDIKWINGEANCLDWQPSSGDPNSGSGKYGTCCHEMDIWEANSMASAYTAHPCSLQGPYRCNGTQCGDGSNRYNGVCDKDGCDNNPFRMGVQNFYGASKVVDTTQPFTVITQFIAPGGTLTEIKRLFKQNGKVIENPYSTFQGLTSYDSITDPACAASKQAFGDPNDFARKGGLVAHGQALARGMVLVMSLWDDYDAHMLWLDSNYPLSKPASQPGVPRGPCPTTSGNPKDVENKYPNSNVRFSNIKFGEIGSTY
jgi:cellulose 1,4-beta-cellobiosidase